MKKINLVLLSIILLFSTNDAYARCHGHYHHYSTPVYVVRSDYFENEQKFSDCDKHYLLTQTTVNFYSNGTKRSYNTYSVLDNNGSILLSNCTNIQHVIHQKKHFFLFKKNGRYYIANSNGEISAKRNYTYMKEISKNRILVKVDKKYGIIDIEENIILPIRYKKFDNLNNGLFLTKLNGYYGLVDSFGNIIIKNEYEKIKRLYDTYILKKMGKFGLADINGKIILEAKNNSITKLGEYILVKNNKTRVFNSEGKLLVNQEFDKVRINRNNLEGKIKKQKFVNIEL